MRAMKMKGWLLPGNTWVDAEACDYHSCDEVMAHPKVAQFLGELADIKTEFGFYGQMFIQGATRVVTITDTYHLEARGEVILDSKDRIERFLRNLNEDAGVFGVEFKWEKTERAA